ncbi:hypothetical protein YPPY66_3758 [Yersinia pestis PY-66]|uniref:Uncharacterized protein n=1 Tax=Yersinia pestis PY-08 TaxID=992134 RepID=A0AB72ZFK0_YERPE|nr:hypothetical protein [Yersinia pestis]AEL72814.1 hypothetical protein A1122_10855 [Yersinia pestis A1122]EEO79657.1 hypothetical protein YPF_3646 [Yersinia pestis biovar Orientalis str. India 195]EEO85029.1 hypothetical protein YPH_0867 [Yersinia pestis biovar Orientalis str. PEXU2]EIQ86881.1 hypothetical protein YPPY02_3444 [Yersinia pestis PY-02]EIR04019.1 hypothetical protein YPPY06_3494 [Yersinia pestis PY-06]EIR14755.1 hypothetical protein YPPY07_3370 [Yersinia pestis PY-07]EIR15653.
MYDETAKIFAVADGKEKVSGIGYPAPTTGLSLMGDRVLTYQLGLFFKKIA